MIIYRSLGDARLLKVPRALAIGIFDGVHRGHQRVLASMLRSARRLKAKAMAVTFDPHPSSVLFPDRKSPKILMSLPHRLRLLESLGINEALVIPFDRKFASLSHTYFLESILLKRLGMRSVSIGHDFCFGHRALGTAEYLKNEARRLGFYFFRQSALKSGRAVISSTRIRSLIEKGDLRRAAAMLGRPVSVYGTVISGRGRGRKIGFPTANLNPHHEAVPPAGVYAAIGFLGQKRLKAVIHIGERPTFKDRERSLEAHFLGLSRNLYGKDIELFFMRKLRETRRFESAEALREAIREDIRRTRRLAN